MDQIDTIFQGRMYDGKWNTSFPINPSDWAKFRVDGELPFGGITEISYYLHIPFCNRLCSFCEYTRMVCPEEKRQKLYLETLNQDICKFEQKYNPTKLKGFDIGGGTPTALGDDCFGYLLDIYRGVIDRHELSSDFESSIESTFESISQEKARKIRDVGIKRISLGVQSTTLGILNQNNRIGSSVESMVNTIKMLHEVGIEKVNVDLMYGLKGQNLNSLQKDLQVVRDLNAEQVTLYELRTNMISENAHHDKQTLFDMYSFWHENLIGMGYKARFGQNTFSKSDSDFGVSSYLRSRMLESTPYKGFGISAQSMSRYGISYNKGKGSKCLDKLVDSCTFENGDVYILPKYELASKYIAIGAYSGSFSLNVLNEILGTDSAQFFKKELDYCLSKDLITIEDARVYITEKGFKNYGAVFSLYYKQEKA